jgi:hypothetical protein
LWKESQIREIKENTIKGLEPELNLITRKFEEEKKRIISDNEQKILKVKDDYESAIERII